MVSYVLACACLVAFVCQLFSLLTVQVGITKRAGFDYGLAAHGVASLVSAASLLSVLSDGSSTESTARSLHRAAALGPALAHLAAATARSGRSEKYDWVTAVSSAAFLAASQDSAGATAAQASVLYTVSLASALLEFLNHAAQASEGSATWLQPLVLRLVARVLLLAVLHITAATLPLATARFFPQKRLQNSLMVIGGYQLTGSLPLAVTIATGVGQEASDGDSRARNSAGGPQRASGSPRPKVPGLGKHTLAWRVTVVRLVDAVLLLHMYMNLAAPGCPSPYQRPRVLAASLLRSRGDFGAHQGQCLAVGSGDEGGFSMTLAESSAGSLAGRTIRPAMLAALRCVGALLVTSWGCTAAMVNAMWALWPRPCRPRYTAFVNMVAIWVAAGARATLVLQLAQGMPSGAASQPGMSWRHHSPPDVTGAMQTVLTLLMNLLANQHSPAAFTAHAVIAVAVGSSMHMRLEPAARLTAVGALYGVLVITAGLLSWTLSRIDHASNARLSAAPPNGLLASTEAQPTPRSLRAPDSASQSLAPHADPAAAVTPSNPGGDLVEMPDLQALFGPDAGDGALSRLSPDVLRHLLASVQASRGLARGEYVLAVRAPSERASAERGRSPRPSHESVSRSPSMLLPSYSSGQSAGVPSQAQHPAAGRESAQSRTAQPQLSQHRRQQLQPQQPQAQQQQGAAHVYRLLQPEPRSPVQHEQQRLQRQQQRQRFSDDQQRSPSPQQQSFTGKARAADALSFTNTATASADAAGSPFLSSVRPPSPTAALASHLAGTGADVFAAWRAAGPAAPTGAACMLSNMGSSGTIAPSPLPSPWETLSETATTGAAAVAGGDRLAANSSMRRIQAPAWTMHPAAAHRQQQHPAPQQGPDSRGGATSVDAAWAYNSLESTAAGGAFSGAPGGDAAAQAIGTATAALSAGGGRGATAEPHSMLSSTLMDADTYDRLLSSASSPFLLQNSQPLTSLPLPSQPLNSQQASFPGLPLGDTDCHSPLQDPRSGHVPLRAPTLYQRLSSGASDASWSTQNGAAPGGMRPPQTSRHMSYRSFNGASLAAGMEKSVVPGAAVDRSGGVQERQVITLPDGRQVYQSETLAAAASAGLSFPIRIPGSPNAAGGSDPLCFLQQVGSRRRLRSGHGESAASPRGGPGTPGAAAERAPFGLDDGGSTRSASLDLTLPRSRTPSNSTVHLDTRPGRYGSSNYPLYGATTDSWRHLLTSHTLLTSHAHIASPPPFAAAMAGATASGSAGRLLSVASGAAPGGGFSTAAPAFQGVFASGAGGHAVAATGATDGPILRVPRSSSGRIASSAGAMGTADAGSVSGIYTTAETGTGASWQFYASAASATPTSGTAYSGGGASLAYNRGSLDLERHLHDTGLIRIGEDETANTSGGGGETGSQHGPGSNGSTSGRLLERYADMEGAAVAAAATAGGPFGPTSGLAGFHAAQNLLSQGQLVAQQEQQRRAQLLQMQALGPPGPMVPPDRFVPHQALQQQPLPRPPLPARGRSLTGVAPVRERLAPHAEEDEEVSLAAEVPGRGAGGLRPLPELLGERWAGTWQTGAKPAHDGAGGSTLEEAQQLLLRLSQAQERPLEALPMGHAAAAGHGIEASSGPTFGVAIGPRLVQDRALDAARLSAGRLGSNPSGHSNAPPVSGESAPVSDLTLHALLSSHTAASSSGVLLHMSAGGSAAPGSGAAGRLLASGGSQRSGGSSSPSLISFADVTLGAMLGAGGSPAAGGAASAAGGSRLLGHSASAAGSDAAADGGGAVGKAGGGGPDEPSGGAAGAGAAVTMSARRSVRAQTLAPMLRTGSASRSVVSNTQAHGSAGGMASDSIGRLQAMDASLATGARSSGSHLFGLTTGHLAGAAGPAHAAPDAGAGAAGPQHASLPLPKRTVELGVGSRLRPHGQAQPQLFWQPMLSSSFDAAKLASLQHLHHPFPQQPQSESGEAIASGPGAGAGTGGRAGETRPQHPLPWAAGARTAGGPGGGGGSTSQGGDIATTQVVLSPARADEGSAARPGRDGADGSGALARIDDTARLSKTLKGMVRGLRQRLRSAAGGKRVSRGG